MILRKKTQHFADKARLEELKRLSRSLGINFHDFKLFDQSLTHSSYVNEKGFQGKNNQRLEYLGDSVLGLLVNEYIYGRFPDYAEGQLARIKSHVVSEKSLSRVALELSLGTFILMGKGEISSGGRKRVSILADALEAVIGAHYLDQGIEKSRKFIIHILGASIDSIKHPGQVRDPKSVIQEKVQAQYNLLPVYRIVSQTGPDHRREFVCSVSVNGKEIASGTGRSKKEAEKKAAAEALKRI